MNYLNLSRDERQLVARYLTALALEHLQEALRWTSPDSATAYAEHMIVFESILSAAEVASCNRHGGYDVGQPCPAGNLDRLQWLCRKFWIEISPALSASVQRRWPGETLCASPSCSA